MKNASKIIKEQTNNFRRKKIVIKIKKILYNINVNEKSFAKLSK